jgi:NitT/TauT family transport system substrate-binding protein
MEYWSSGVMSKTKTVGPLLITSLYLIIVLLIPTVGVRAAALERLTIGWSAIAGSQAPFWITKEAGLFEKNGLDVTMIYVDGGSKATQALMSGDVPIAQVGGNAPVVARLRGADVTLIAGLLNVLAYSMIVSPEIKSPKI